MLHLQSVDAELINIWTASQICMFPHAGSNVSGYYAWALFYLWPPFTGAYPHMSKGPHNLQYPAQSCLPRTFLGLDYDLLWQILSVNNTAKRKKEE